MFSWSNNTSTSTSRAKSTYPGRRLQQNRAAAAAATPIQGSIRPPSSGSHTRAQHLTSYIEDPTLQRSTRRVSSGTFSTYILNHSTNCSFLFGSILMIVSFLSFTHNFTSYPNFKMTLLTTLSFKQPRETH